MQGIQYVTDEKGQKVAVQINLRKFGEIWEDFFDNLLSRQRAEEQRESIKSVRKRLKNKASCISKYLITFVRSVRKELEALDGKLVNKTLIPQQIPER